MFVIHRGLNSVPITLAPRKAIRQAISCNRYFGTCVCLESRKTIKHHGDGKKGYKKQILEKKPQPTSLSALFTPVPVTVSPDDINVGAELTDRLKKQDLMRILTTFSQREPVRTLSREQGLDGSLFHQAYVSFRRFCLDSETLPADLHIIFSDILQGAGHCDDIYPYFIRHARRVFPHLECMDDLKKISDLRSPANWYPEARSIGRKIIFHAGPTNSGKTFHALERFMQAKSGVYCGPLKLLAVEGFRKANERGTPCDLVTGEERSFASDTRTPAAHVSCTVEMSSVTTPYEVAVIDEIQMIRDRQRGWAWTRALLGINAEEVHVCGEATAIDLVRDICATAGEEVEVRKYKRLTELVIEKEALRNIDRVQPGDAIVCFSKNDIYAVSRQIERLGREVGVIYGGLPPGTKLAQAAKFNDPNDPCKILVATDAIGMGLNLSIRRVIFYSLVKPTLNENGEKEMDVISVSQALQIAGRAGRFGTQFEKGHVTSFKSEDLSTLHELLASPPEEIVQAGLHPTAEQIELYAYHLPHASLSNLMDIFVSLSTVDDSLYFICNIEDFKFLADMIQHVPLPLRARYVFCCAPINKKMAFVCTMFLKLARQYSRNEAVTLDWLCHHIGWPLQTPKTIIDLVHMESVFDVLDLYLWLSYRFQDLFPDVELVRDMQKELDLVIQAGVLSLTKLLKNSETKVSSRTGMLSAMDESLSIRPKFRIESDDDLDESNITRAGQGHQGKKKLSHQRGSRSAAGNDQEKVFGGGKLTEKLIQEGLLTKEMLEEMQQEWRESQKRENPKKNDHDTED